MNEDQIKQYGLRVAERVRDEVCKAAGSAVGIEWMWVDGDLPAIVASVAVPQEHGPRQPVAQITGGKTYMSVELLENCPSDLPNGAQLYLSPPVPRDVLMAFGEEVLDETILAIAEGRDARPVVHAIVDRYASKAPPDGNGNGAGVVEASLRAKVNIMIHDVAVARCEIERLRTQQQEPVNQQLLAALKACLSDDFDTPKPSCKTWHIREQAKSAIAAAEAAQPVAVHPTAEQLYTMVTSRFKSGSFPWGSVAESGKAAWAAAAADLLFAPDTIMARHAKPVAVPDGWQLVPKEPTRAMLDAAHVNFRKDIEIDPLLKTSYRAMLAAAQEGGAA